MNTSPDINLEEIFERAAALPAAERARYLEAACAGQPECRAEIEALLLALVAGGKARASAVWTPEYEAERARGKAEQAGERIGAYRLVEQIGEGGFGTVWLAEQERPVRRQVALKIIKLGMDTREVIARFEQERQALAIMEHPGIAKVFDAGATQTGRPFFAMELVRGVRITEYCDEHGLPTAERLRLFIAVCQAVQHAHQKGIIHRDLKPSNILVTLEDGAPVPKVIDFGIAKATGAERLTELSLHTRTAAMIGTPLYMSPEQAGMGAPDIDTRTDIYSLGVVLYELLTGRPPFEGETSLEEMRRLIREVEPPRPSKVLRGMRPMSPTGLTSPTSPTRGLSADLDWIAMKALEKDRARRYETASALALDVRRHLDHETVLARPASAAYRLKKVVRRNRLAFAAGAAIAASLAIGLAVNLWQAKRAAVLRGTAPTFLAQARELFAQQQPDEALKMIGHALRLAPDDADVHLSRAHMLEALERLPEAIAAYRRVLALRPGDASATANLLICNRLNPAPGAALSLGDRFSLLEAVKAQRRMEDLWPLMRATGQDRETQKALREARLKPLVSLPGWQTPEGKPRIVDNGDDTFTLDLSKLPIGNLLILERLPVSCLILNECPVSDLSPLTNVPLRKLQIAKTQVSNLRPLIHLPLEYLNATGCPIEDLAPLRGLPLARLEIGGTKVRDLAPLQGAPLRRLVANDTLIEKLDALAGMPLSDLQLHNCPRVRDITVLGTLPVEGLDLGECPQIADFSPLLKCPNLQNLIIPKNCRDLESIRRLPKLKKLSDVSFTEFDWKWANVPSADTTLRAFDERRAQAAGLQSAPGQNGQATKALLEARLKSLETLPGWQRPDGKPRLVENSDGTFIVDLSKLPVSNLSMLAGLPVSMLNLNECPVSDLSPLAGLPLHRLDIARTQVSDLRPLADAPLETLDMEFSPVKDLRPLQGRPLRLLEMGGTQVRDLAPLRGAPLKVLCAGSAIENLDALAGMPLDILRISIPRVRDITVLGTLPIEELILSDCPQIADLSPLLKCVNLERLIIPENCPDLESVRRLPKLKQLADVSLGYFQWGWAKVPSAETTLRAIDKRRARQALLEPLRAALRQAGASESQLAKATFAEDGTLDLDLAGLPLSDLHFLAGLPVRKLDLAYSRVSDLTGLCGAPLVWFQAYKCPLRDLTPLAGCSALTFLGLADTQVSDLRPVQGHPLVALHIEGTTPIRDVAALAGCVTLERLTLPRGASGVEALRALPRLQRVSFAWDSVADRVAQTAEEFWAEFEGKKKP